MILTVPVSNEVNLLVASGQFVDFNTPFIEKKTATNEVVSVATKLEIPPDKIFRYLKKFVGEKVEKGEIIALKKNFFSTKSVISRERGKIKEIDHHQGKVIITTSINKKNVIPAGFKGEVIDILKNEIKIKVKSGAEFSLKNASGIFGGEAFYIKDAGRIPLSSSDLSNRILVSESISSYLQSKTEALGIKGYVTLLSLAEETELNTAQIKVIGDLKKIFDLHFPYCLIQKESSKIIFYS